MVQNLLLVLYIYIYLFIIWFNKLRNIKNPRWCNCTALHLPAGNAHTSHNHVAVLWFHVVSEC